MCVKDSIASDLSRLSQRLIELMRIYYGQNLMIVDVVDSVSYMMIYEIDPVVTRYLSNVW